ncbi:MAG: hypothetical protein FWF08_02975 [Oscillospiraceae bacterium]|nr:hypothetical protein [Oscillospiraceae bacterium]
MLKTFWSDDFEALKGDTPMGYSNERLRWGNDRNVATTGLATVDGITYGPYWTVYDADDFNSESSATPADFTLFYHRTMITSDAGVTASYEFLACVVIDGVLHQVRFWDVDGTDVSLDSDGALVLASGASLAETLKIALNNPTGTDGALYKDKVTFGDAYIGQYNKAALVSVDWLAEIPENADMTFDAANNKMTIEALSDEFGWIILNFGNISATPTDGLWYYNEDDGYFYYMGVLGAGQATPYFLESVTLSGDATGAYSGLHFDLIVNMEAIQNTKSAVESDTGWDLSLTAPPALDAFQIKLLTFLK